MLPAGAEGAEPADPARLQLATATPRFRLTWHLAGSEGIGLGVRDTPPSPGAPCTQRREEADRLLDFRGSRRLSQLRTDDLRVVPLSAEEEPRAAVGHLSPGWRAGRRDRECLAEWHVQPRTPGSHLLLPGPRLVFNRVNGRRPPATSPSFEGTQEPYTLAHEENVRFVSEDFVPIDLDEWWAQQFLARITNCS
ncbi:MAPK regulated corepressor interacting protein 2 isoform 3-T3 [Dama dama]|uniref:MAPK regulated corepressor interacting protein 2 isoform X3 n=1 Tax=Dama dama TaxID=30532 RepID=UPI002A36E94F|nr:MAPK regulated corepressor interacting protein 2 isoform X3 [Dama dama]